MYKAYGIKYVGRDTDGVPYLYVQRSHVKLAMNYKHDPTKYRIITYRIVPIMVEDYSAWLENKPIVCVVNVVNKPGSARVYNTDDYHAAIAEYRKTALLSDGDTIEYKLVQMQNVTDTEK